MQERQSEANACNRKELKRLEKKPSFLDAEKQCILILIIFVSNLKKT